MTTSKGTQQLINELEGMQAPVCMSIYTPLDYDSPDALNANKIRIKNIISEIKRLNESSDSFDVKDIKKHVKPLQELMESPESLWQRDAKSLAVFASSDFVKYKFLPIEQKEKKEVISNNFLVEPLRQLVSDNQSFYVLSASHDQVELYYGDKYHLEQVALEALPQKGAKETIGIDEYPQSLQFHPATSSNAKIGNRSIKEQFHGQYNAVEVDRNIMKKYFRSVNNVVSNYLKGKKVPLIFAGVNYLFPLYEQVNSYKHLMHHPIEGNFQHNNVQELHNRALQLV